MFDIRPYTPADREAVRRICCDTADAGRPLENFGLHNPAARDLFADLLISYYTDHEPESFWVASDAGRTLGYIGAAFDTRRAQTVMRRRVFPAAVWRAVIGGILLDKGVWRMLSCNSRRKPAPTRADIIDLDQYPAHVHLNLDAAARGRGIGMALFEAFMAKARRISVRGVHAWVRSDNAGALRFFTKAGFEELGRCPMMWRDADTLLYSTGFGMKLTQ